DEGNGGGHRGRRRRPAPRGSARVLPAPARAHRAEGPLPLGRRAADAGHRAGPGRASAHHAGGRAHRGPRPAAGAEPHRDPARDQPPRHHHPAGRADPRGRDGPLAPALRDGPGPDPVRGHPRGAAPGPDDPAALPERLTPAAHPPPIRRLSPVYRGVRTESASGFPRLAWSNLAAQSAEQIGLAATPLVAVLALGAGAGETGFLQTAQTLPFLILAIPAGLLADRMPRRRLMAVAEAVRAGSLIVTLVLAQTGRLTLSWLALLGFAGACGTVAYSVTAPSLVPSLVPPEGLAAANARLELA